MKNILITGANSYIGESVEAWLLKSQEYQVDTLDMKSDTWREYDFSRYDVIFHVAGIAHIKAEPELYDKVNRELAIETAQKAKNAGVRQFILLSSMSVYGKTCGTITKTTEENPNTPYGIAKYQADQAIEKLADDKFKVCILRPPMVYGRGCKGNYNGLRKAALKVPFFPYINNSRSMIYITNLAAFVEKMIREESEGIFFPQNAEYVCTSDMVYTIAKCHGKRIHRTSLFNWMIKLALKCKINIISKVFGSLTYEQTDICDEVDFETSILETESTDET